MADPVILDPFQTIINVGWSQTELVALMVRSQSENTFVEVPVDGGTPWTISPNVGDIQLMNGSIPVPLAERVRPAPGPAIGQVVTADMLDFYTIWSYANRIEQEINVKAINYAYLFFNIAGIKAFAAPATVDTITFTLSRGTLDAGHGDEANQGPNAAGNFELLAYYTRGVTTFAVAGDGKLVEPTFLDRERVFEQGAHGNLVTDFTASYTCVISIPNKTVTITPVYTPTGGG